MSGCLLVSTERLLQDFQVHRRWEMQDRLQELEELQILQVPTTDNSGC